MVTMLLARVAAWRRYQVSVRELTLLSDSELNDLGIGRADITHIAREGTGSTAAS